MFVEIQEIELGIQGILQSLGEFGKLVELEVPCVMLLGPDPKHYDPAMDGLSPNVHSPTLRDDMAIYRSFSWMSSSVLSCLQLYNPKLWKLKLHIKESD